MVEFVFDNPIVLENQRALLRPLEKSDHPYLLPVILDAPVLLRFSPTPIPTAEALTTYIDQALCDREKRLRYAFTIFDKEKQQFAGGTSLLAISNKDSRLEIGYTWIGRDFQRTGLNRACKFLLMQYAFETLEFERVELKTDERNIQSRTAIEGIGGKYEGTLRSHTLMYDGFRRNTVYYSILRQEWPEVKQRLVGNLLDIKTGL